VDKARLKEQCRMRLPPTANEHLRDRMSERVPLKPLRWLGLLEKIAHAALRCERESAERDLASKGGWAYSQKPAEMGGLLNRLQECKGGISAGARSWISNSHVVVDGWAIWWPCVVVVARLARAAPPITWILRAEMAGTGSARDLLVSGV
jgi:hypothetical protein